jgi:hypothetical protein
MVGTAGKTRLNEYREEGAFTDKAALKRGSCGEAISPALADLGSGLID